MTTYKVIAHYEGGDDAIFKGHPSVPYGLLDQLESEDRCLNYSLYKGEELVGEWNR